MLLLTIPHLETRYPAAGLALFLTDEHPPLHSPGGSLAGLLIT